MINPGEHDEKSRDVQPSIDVNIILHIYISNNIIYIIYIHSSIKDYKSTCVNICKNLLCSMQIQL